MTTISVVRIKRTEDSEWIKALELKIGMLNTHRRIYDVFGEEVISPYNIERYKKRKLNKTLRLFP